jgi:hypothetical protein
MKTQFAALSLGLAVVGFFPASALATFTLTGSQLAGVNLSVPALGVGDTGSATYSSGSGGQITLTSGDSVASYYDTAQILITNGFDGAVLGTVNSFYSSGASFNVVSYTGSNSAYWDMTISNGVNTYMVNFFGDNTTGANVVGNSFGITSSPQLGNLFESMATFESTYGTYNVLNVTIDEGGWDTGTETSVINSITLPGTYDPPRVPDGGSTVSLLGMGLIVMGALWRKLKVLC